MMLIIPQETSSYATLLISALFAIARTLKQPRCPSAEEWIKKMWYTSTMEYYSPVKTKNTRKFEGKWMELEKKSS